MMATTVGLSGPAQAQPAPDPAPRVEVATRLAPAEFAARLVQRTNTRRDLVGCGPLRVHPALVLAATRHTVRMANRRQMSHQFPGEARLGDRVENAGYHGWEYVAENIAWAESTAPGRIFELWIQSPPHRRHIQDCSLREIGIAVRYGGGRTWATQDFGRR
jgi:uncharacterized protein YkwD